MKLSIITCTYNSATYLQQCIDSVIAQWLHDDVYEHIFVDAFSKDETMDMLNNYKRTRPKKHITIMQRDPKGIYNAMNEWIKIAQWEYLLFLHSDDYLEKKSLQNYLNFIEKTESLGLYYAKFNAVDENRKLIYNAPARDIYKKWLKKWLFGFICYINQPAVIHKRELHAKYGYFNENMKIMSDREFWIVLSQNKVSNLFYNQTVTNFRIHGDSASNNKKLHAIATKEQEWIWNIYYGPEKYIMKLVNFAYMLLYTLSKLLRKASWV